MSDAFATVRVRDLPLPTWMVHCHIAEHLHSGMMFGFVVVE